MINEWADKTEPGHRPDLKKYGKKKGGELRNLVQKNKLKKPQLGKGAKK